MNRIAPFRVLAMALVAASVNADAKPFAVVGYLPEYRIASVTAAQVGPVTDLVFFGIEPPADGRLPNSVVARATLRKLHDLKRLRKCKLLVCIGGWNRSAGFPALARDGACRKRLIAGLIDYCQNNQFDGVDYDWEHPKGEGQLGDYARLLAETKAAFREKQLIVTVAQAGWQNLGDVAYQAVDRVHLMSYDHDFPQATFLKSKADVERLLGWRCPAEKIALGLPFYGRNQRNEARTYGELVGQQPVDSNLDRIEGFAFNGQATILRKLQFARRHQLAGVMIWELGQDAARKDTSLVRSIQRGIASPIDGED